MTMRWDPVLTAAVARELSEALSGERLKAIFVDRGAGTLHAYFGRATLLADLDPSRVGLDIREAADPPEGARTFPCRLSTVEALPDERILVLVLPRVRGRGGVVRIVLEMVPNRGNATVVEGDDWTVRHVLTDRGGARTPRVGRPYPLPDSTRRGLEAPLSLEEWRDLLGLVEPRARKGPLLRHVALASPVNAAVLLGDAVDGGGDTDTGTDSGQATDGDELALAAGHGFWMHLLEIGLGSASAEAYVVQCPWGPQPYPVCLPGYECEPSQSLLDAIREVRATLGTATGLIPSGLTGGPGRRPLPLEQAYGQAPSRTRASARSSAAQGDGRPDPGPPSAGAERCVRGGAPRIRRRESDHNPGSGAGPPAERGPLLRQGRPRRTGEKTASRPDPPEPGQGGGAGRTLGTGRSRNGHGKKRSAGLSRKESYELGHHRERPSPVCLTASTGHRVGWRFAWDADRGSTTT